MDKRRIVKGNLRLKRSLRSKRKREVEAAIQSLETDIEKYSFATEKENNLTLLTKANSFRVTVREKKETLSSLENVLIKLNEEQKQI